MIAIVYVSLVINVVVAGFWGIVLGFYPRTHFRYGPYGADTTGTRILSSLYLTIALFSLYALLIVPSQMFAVCIFLFGFQIVYKLLTVITVRDIRNPVILSNLAIVLIHSISLWWICNSEKK